MRIENNVRTAAIGARSTTGRSGTAGPAFEVRDPGPAQRAAAAAPTGPTAAIDALLALQAVEDPLLTRKRLVRRGRSLLDALDALRADLLVGAVGEGHLNQIMALIGQVRERHEPGLDAVLDEIELRARVELAKRGLFPGP